MKNTHYKEVKSVQIILSWFTFYKIKCKISKKNGKRKGDA